MSSTQRFFEAAGSILQGQKTQPKETVFCGYTEEGVVSGSAEVAGVKECSSHSPTPTRGLPFASLKRTILLAFFLSTCVYEPSKSRQDAVTGAISTVGKSGILGEDRLEALF